MESFKETIQRGNQLYTKVMSDDPCPAVYQIRMMKAVGIYNSALQLSGTDRDQSNTEERIGLAHWMITQKFMKSKTSRTAEILEHLEHAISHFGKAVECGIDCQSQAWASGLREKISSSIDIVWKTFKAESSNDEGADVKHSKTALQKFQVFSGKVQQKSAQGQCFAKIHDLLVERALSANMNEAYAEARNYLEEALASIEMAKQAFGENSEKIREMTRTTLDHIYLCESRLSRREGDRFLAEGVLESEVINMDYVWQAVDCYRQAINKSRERCIEDEAFINSKLGKVYDEILKKETDARECYRLAVSLALSLESRNFETEEWFKRSQERLKALQDAQAWKEESEREKIRAPILEKFKDVLQTLREKRNSMKPEEFLNHLYTTHPPKQGKLHLDLAIKERLTKAMAHYHPDKQSVEKHGLEWKVMSEEITKLLTSYYERFKGDTYSG